MYLKIQIAASKWVVSE